MSDTRQSKSLVERLADKRDRAASTTKTMGGDPQYDGAPLSSDTMTSGLSPSHDELAVPSGRGKSKHFAKIDLKRLRSKGFVTPEGGRSKIVEEFRAIKRPLLRRAFEDDAHGRNHVIMVVSSKPSEGKTFCSINLAMSIASERGLNVLLVDGDVIKADLPDVMGFKAKQGFLDVLVDKNVDIQDVLVRTNVPNLTILPSGRSQDHATELLSGPGMSSLVSDIATRYSDRVIVINAPPVLVSSEAAVLATHAGQIVMVVEADKTSKRDVALALAQMEGTDKISFVLNKVTDRRVTDRYGAYSYYGRK
jgi:protein-tyrosine kinase